MPSPAVLPRLAAAALLGALAVAGLAGCTASGASSSAAAGSGTAAGSAAALSASGPRSKAAAVDRSVVTTATLELVAADPIRAAERIEAVVAAADGTVQRSTEDPTGRATADLVVRVPAARFPETLRRIEQGWRVHGVHVDATDVTGRVTDTATRVTNLRTSIARLQKLLADAGSTSDLVTIESTLTQRQSSLETLLGQQQVLADQVASATLTIAVVEPAAVPRTGPADFLAGFGAGAEGLARTASGTAVVLGVLAPWVLVLGALSGGAVLLLRTARRRGAARTSG